MDRSPIHYLIISWIETYGNMNMNLLNQNVKSMQFQGMEKSENGLIRNFFSNFELFNSETFLMNINYMNGINILSNSTEINDTLPCFIEEALRFLENPKYRYIFSFNFNEIYNMFPDDYKSREYPTSIPSLNFFLEIKSVKILFIYALIIYIFSNLYVTYIEKCESQYVEFVDDVRNIDLYKHVLHDKYIDEELQVKLKKLTFLLFGRLYNEINHFLTLNSDSLSFYDDNDLQNICYTEIDKYYCVSFVFFLNTIVDAPNQFSIPSFFLKTSINKHRVRSIRKVIEYFKASNNEPESEYNRLAEYCFHLSYDLGLGEYFCLTDVNFIEKNVLNTINLINSHLKKIKDDIDEGNNMFAHQFFDPNINFSFFEYTAPYIAHKNIIEFLFTVYLHGFCEKVFVLRMLLHINLDKEEIFILYRQFIIKEIDSSKNVENESVAVMLYKNVINFLKNLKFSISVSVESCLCKYIVSFSREIDRRYYNQEDILLCFQKIQNYNYSTIFIDFFINQDKIKHECVNYIINIMIRIKNVQLNSSELIGTKKYTFILYMENYFRVNNKIQEFIDNYEKEIADNLSSLLNNTKNFSTYDESVIVINMLENIFEPSIYEQYFDADKGYFVSKLRIELYKVILVVIYDSLNKVYSSLLEHLIKLFYNLIITDNGVSELFSQTNYIHIFDLIYCFFIDQHYNYIYYDIIKKIIIYIHKNPNNKLKFNKQKILEKLKLKMDINFYLDLFEDYIDSDVEKYCWFRLLNGTSEADHIRALAHFIHNKNRKFIYRYEYYDDPLRTKLVRIQMNKLFTENVIKNQNLIMTILLAIQEITLKNQSFLGVTVDKI